MIGEPPAKGDLQFRPELVDHYKMMFFMFIKVEETAMIGAKGLNKGVLAQLLFMALLLTAALSGVRALAAPLPTFTATASGTISDLTLVANMNVGDADVGKTGNIYVAARVGKVGDEWVANNGAAWISWTGGALPVYAVGPLADRTIELVRNENLSPFLGTQVYVGYGLSESDMLDNGKYGLVYTVFANTVTAGQTSSIAIKVDGTLWAWGNNSYGQLGDGTTEVKNKPNQIDTATGWASVSSGAFHTIAIKTDGTLWAWGGNTDGQLGDGTNVSKNTPTKIGTATNWASVSAGTYHTLAIKTDGTLWAWGSNEFGHLGDGTSRAKNAPIQIGRDTNWVSVSAGSYHTLAIKSDGTLWAWGRNEFGQLGDGTTDTYYTPI